MNRIFIVLAFVVAVQTFAKAQISGKVVYPEGDGAVGASILFVGTEEGTITDVNGEFNINREDPLEVTISYVGYMDTTLILRPNIYNTVDLKLGPNLVTNCPIFIPEKYTNGFGFQSIEKINIAKVNLLNPSTIYNPSPGLFMHNGAANTNRLTVRGIGSRSPFSTTKIKAYLNDIPLTSGIGQTNLEDINLAIIDAVKIYKGPTMPRFGAGLGGVIHYRTYGHDRSNNSVSNTSSYGSFGTIHNNINYNYAKDGIVFSLNNDVLKSDGFRDNNNYQRQIISGFAQANYDKDILTVFVNHTLLDAQIPSALNIEDFSASPEAAAANWKAVEGSEDYSRTQVAITHQRIFNNDWSSSVTGFLNNFQNYERRPFNVLTQNAKSLGTRISIDKAFRNFGGELKFGSELFSENEEWSTYETLDQGQGNILSDNFEKRNYINLFAEFEYVWNRFQIDAGLNYNVTNYDFEDRFIADGIDQSGKYAFQPVLSPFLSLSYQKLNQIFYGTLSHGFSAPTLEETLTPDGQINPDIRPEIGWNTELGYKKKYQDFSFDLSIYNMWVQDLLVAERVTEDQFVGINAGKTMHPGLETQLSYDKIFKKNTNQLNAKIAYQYQPHHFTEFVNREIDFAGKRLPGNPDHKLSSQLDYKIGRAYLNFSNLYVSKMYADDLNSIEIDSYILSNFSLGYDLYKNNQWSINSGFDINNIFDVDYASMVAVNPRSFGTSLPRYLYAGLPRNFKITVQLNYRFN